MHWLSALDRMHIPYEKNYPLAKLTTWGVGGNAELLAIPENFEMVSFLVQMANDQELPLWILGGGSNVLISDQGLPGLTVWTSELNRGRCCHEKGNAFSFLCEAGFPLNKALCHALQSGAGGAEFLIGIPGTVGGAIWGNVGASGKSIGTLVEWVETVESDGSLRRWNKKEIEWTYRFSGLSTGKRMVLRVRFLLGQTDKEKIRKSIHEFWKKREAQPYGRKTAGCVFKNPKEGPAAGELLDRCGCKGLRYGDAVVSERHANFIENCGQATASEIYTLSQECRKRVLDQFGISLEYEVKILGEFISRSE